MAKKDRVIHISPIEALGDFYSRLNPTTLIIIDNFNKRALDNSVYITTDGKRLPKRMINGKITVVDNNSHRNYILDEYGNFTDFFGIDKIGKDGYWWKNSDGTTTFHSYNKKQSKDQKDLSKSPVVKPSTPTYYYTRLYKSRLSSPIEGQELKSRGDVKTFQQKLKDYYAPGTYKDNGIWGKNTERAYLAYLVSKNNFQPEIVSASSPVTTLLPSNLGLTKLIPEPQMNINIPIQTKIYDRTGIRQFIRDKGLNPYSFEGYQRKALRKVMNGVANEKDKLIVKLMGILKKGGSLISKNAIDRFKAKCGTKIKTNKCGSKLKKHQLGGSLKHISFMLEGTPKKGIQYKPDWYKSILATQGVFDNNSGNYYELKTKRSLNGDIFNRKIRTLYPQIVSDTTYEYFPKKGRAEIESTSSLYHNRKNYERLREMFKKIASIPVNRSPIDLL